MKTFVAAIVIFALICSFVAGTSLFVQKRTCELSALALALPGSTAEFLSEAKLCAKTDELCALWAQSMKLLPFFATYDLLDRADDAALALSAAAKTGCKEDFLSARLRFIDAINRLKIIFSLSPESIT